MKKRMFRKIRLICFAFLLVLTIAFIHNHITTDKVVYTSFCKYVVEPKDTLWDIAHEYNFNNQDVRKVIYDIRKTNDIGCDIYVGQVIIIPVDKLAMDTKIRADDMIASSN